jgi:hypothetical protein
MPGAQQNSDPLPEKALQRVYPMSETNRHDLMLEALAELAPEIMAHRRVHARSPQLQRTLEDFLPLPPHSLFLGVANDGLPVLLNISDSVPGPMLIIGDEGSGKSGLLRVIARSTDEIHSSKDVQYGVITTRPDEWKSTEGSPNRVEVFPADDPGAEEFVHTLAEWAHSNHGEKQSVLLFIDDLSALMNMDASARQDLRWLLLRGPSRKVWPIATLHPRRAPDVHPWTSFFHTRLFGRISDPRDLNNLAGGAKPRLETLDGGTEFMLREGNDWLKFWIPSID